jgi:hypothetical protein
LPSCSSLTGATSAATEFFLEAFLDFGFSDSSLSEPESEESFLAETFEFFLEVFLAGFSDSLESLSELESFLAAFLAAFFGAGFSDSLELSELDSFLTGAFLAAFLSAFFGAGFSSLELSESSEEEES